MPQPRHWAQTTTPRGTSGTRSKNPTVFQICSSSRRYSYIRNKCSPEHLRRTGPCTYGSLICLSRLCCHRHRQGSFLLLSLRAGAVHVYIETIDSLPCGKLDWNGISAALFDRDVSLTRQEESITEFDTVRLEKFRKPGEAYHAALTSLVSKIEVTSLVMHPAHRNSAAKLRVLTRSLKGLRWAFYAYFCLPALYSYPYLV